MDFGRTASDYGRFRAGFPDALFERLARYGIGQPGQRILDLGTGTGTMARGFARRGAVVLGLDRAEPLLRQAQELDRAAAVATRYLVGRAETLSVADATLDVVSAGQCWHWFDRPLVMTEVRRVLVPRGRLVIAHFDWLPLVGNVVEATERLIEAYNPAWPFGGGMGMYPQWLPELTAGGFTNVETFSFDVEVPYSHEAWRGRIRASAGVAATLTGTEVGEFDTELARLLVKRFAEDPLSVPHRTFAIVARPA